MLPTSRRSGWLSPNPSIGGEQSLTYWGKGKGQPGGWNSRQGFESFGHSTSKIPPYWEPSLELKGYPFRVWMQDLDVWSAGTELQSELVAPAVVQRLGGAARELVRAVPASELRDGRHDLATGAITSGLQLVVRGLERRFGAFAVETSTRVIIDLLGFNRRSAESIDEALARFETLKGHVQAQAAGFMLPIPVLSWLLLERLHVPRRTWPLVLMAFQGRFPENDEGFRNLIDSLRHQGHVAESPQAGSNSFTGRGGQYFADESPYLYGTDLCGGELSPTNEVGSYWDASGTQDWPVEQPVFLDEEGWPACSECSAYFDDEGAHSTDTGSDWEEAADTEELQAYLGSFDGCTRESLREEYFIAKARFRHFSGKSSRRRRFPRRHVPKGRGRGGGGKRTHRRAWLAGEPAFKGSSLGKSALAGGKGKGKSGVPMGKGKGRNPCDPSGRQMECFRCGSRDHLSMNCHLPKGKGKGRGGKKGMFWEDGTGFWQDSAIDGAEYSGFVDSARSFLTMPNGEQFQIDSEGERIPEESAFPISAEYEQSWLPASDGQWQLDSLIGHQVVSHHQPLVRDGSSSVPVAPESGREACGLVHKVVSHHQPAAQSRSFTYTTPQLLREEYLGSAAPSVRPAGFPKPRPKPKPKEWQSLMPDQPSPEGWFPTDIQAAYLASVRLPHGTSLLVDTGSPGNITSDGWSEDHSRELAKAGLTPPQYVQRSRPMVCSGIGHGTQQAEWDVVHPICLGAGRLDKYTAPELPNAETPALLGQRSMKALRTLIDTFTGKIFFIGEGGYELRLSPGSEMHELEESPVGHLMLPCSRFAGQRPGRSSESQSFVVGSFFEDEHRHRDNDDALLKSMDNPDFWLS